MNLLVTGAAGFIGREVCKQAIDQGISLTIVDSFLNESYRSQIKRNNWEFIKKYSQKMNLAIQCYEMDILDPNFAPHIRDAEVICNLAAMPGLPKSWSNFDLYIQSNLMTVEAILKNMSRDAFLVHASTSSVYGKSATSDEKSICSPYSPYGVSKLAAENLIKTYAENFDIRFTILRFFSVYGPFQRPDMGFHKFIQSSLTSRPIDIYGDGTSSRTNTFVTDCANATLKAIEKKFNREIFNISGTEEFSVNEILEIIQEITGKIIQRNYKQARAGDQTETRGSIEKAKRLLGLTQSRSMREGLEAQIKTVRENSKMYEE
jgi:nucleoside-diphosphate-sugar epimerase